MEYFTRTFVNSAGYYAYGDQEERKAFCRKNNLDPFTWYGKAMKNGQIHYATVDRTTTWRSAERKIAKALGVPVKDPITEYCTVDISNMPEDIINGLKPFDRDRNAGIPEIIFE